MGLLKKVFKTKKVTGYIIKIALFGVITAIVISAVACSSDRGFQQAAKATSPLPPPPVASTPSQTLTKAKWIEPEASGDTVSVNLSDITANKIIHFYVTIAATGKETFMAYYQDGKLYVRASICPPCRSIGFSLGDNVLQCDICFTKFNATTGQGISGACVNYPKAAVEYQTSGDKITMNVGDLVQAYQNTLTPGLP